MSQRDVPLSDSAFAELQRSSAHVETVTFEELQRDLIRKRQEAMQPEIDFKNQVKVAIKSRFGLVEEFNSVQKRAYPLERDPDLKVSVRTLNGKEPKRWLVFALYGQRRVSRSSVERKLRTCWEEIQEGGGDAVILVTENRLPERTQIVIDASPIEVVTCTLKQLQAGEVSLSASLPGRVDSNPKPDIAQLRPQPRMPPASLKSDENSQPPGRVVQIEVGGAKQKEATAALKALRHEVRSTNQPVLRADVRDRILKQVEGGEGLISVATVSIEAVKGMLPAPIRWLATKVGIPLAVREAAVRAWNAVTALFPDEPDIWL